MTRFNAIESLLSGVDAKTQIDQARQNRKLSRLQSALAGQIAEGSFDLNSNLDFAQIAALDPERADRMAIVFNNLSEGRKKAYFEDLQTILNSLEAKDTQRALNITDKRLSDINKLNGDPSGTLMIKQRIMNGDIPSTIANLKKVEAVGIDRGYLADPLERDERKARIQAQRRGPTKTANQKDLETFERLISEAEASGTEKDRKKAERFGRKAGFIRETEQENADIKVDAAMRKTVAESNAERKQGFIDSGIQAADGVANLNRALNLLDEVKTGGFNNVALKAKRLFGVEGADPGELSNLMGKAVLAQLKPIFGAAFTAREGEALAELEAKFSNSPANNRRLIENALRLADRAARRGIAAAEDQGDMFTANEIKEAMSFNLRDKLSDSTPKAPQPTPAPNQFEGFRIIRK